MLPAYMKIHDQIKSEIDQKIWKIGERLPSERDLAEKFQVSRMLLRHWHYMKMRITRVLLQIHLIFQ